jgi:alpha-L-fucosidase
VDNYHPDLLYSDGGVPFGNSVGMSMIAHLYNSNAALHGGKVQAVYNCKQVSGGRWVEDLERGIMPRIDPNPWQTDTSIGDWFYNRNWKNRPLSWIVHTLVDNVSKNGNLLLNVVQRPDGSLDPDVEQMLRDMAKWTATHGEAIFGSRPWLVYGEGPVRAKGGSFKEDYTYTARDIRFTTKGHTLYALALGWPDDNQIIIRSLARPGGENINQIKNIRLLGYRGQLTWNQTPDALVVKLPAQKISDLTVGLKITGADLKPAPVSTETAAIGPNAAGVLTLSADTANLNGAVQVEAQGGKPNIGFWDSGNDWVSWKGHFPRAGTYRVKVNVASLTAGTKFLVEVGAQKLTASAPLTGSWSGYQDVDAGQIEITHPGDENISVRPGDPASWKPINLTTVTLTPVP